MATGGEVASGGLAALTFGVAVLLFSRLTYRSGTPRGETPTRSWRWYWH